MDETNTTRPRTVKVTGGDLEEKEELYTLYFENRRRGGGAISDVTVDHAQQAIYITFEDPQTAEDVCKRQHRVGGRDLQVTLEVPKQTPTEDTGKAGGEVKKTKDTEERADCQHLGDSVQTSEVSPKMEEESSVLTESVSNCLVVKGLKPSTIDDSVKYYFANRRRSGGGPVREVVISDSGNLHTGFVYFEKNEDLCRVLTKSHTIEGQTVRVKRYTEYLRISGSARAGSGDSPSLTLPEPIVLKDMDKFKLEFIRFSLTERTDLLKLLEEKNAVPMFSGDTVTLECTLKMEVPEQRLRARRWASDTRRTIQSFLLLINVHRIDIMQHIWTDVSESVAESVISKPDEVMTIPLGDEYAIVVVGKQDSAKVAFDQIKSRVRSIEEEFERKKRKVTSTNDKLERYQLQLLEAISFPTGVAKRYKSLSVYIKTEEGEITFHGMEHDVEKAVEEMNDLLNTLQTEKITDMSKNQKRLLETAETREIITEKFKSEQMAAVWEVGKDVTVYGLREHVTKAVSNIRESVVQLSFELKPESAKLLDSREYLGFVEGLVEHHEGKLMIVPSQNGQQVCITGTNDIVHEVGKKVQNFIQENTIYSEVLCYSPSRQRFVATFWQNKLQLITNDLQAYCVDLSVKEDRSALRASGTSVGLQQVKQRLQQLEKEITVHVQTFADPETVAFLTPGKCEADLDLMGSCEQCVLALVPEPAGMQVVTPAGGQAFGSVQCTVGTGTSVQGVSAASICVINISIIEGEIAKQQADVIVNSTSSGLDLNNGGGVLFHPEGWGFTSARRVQKTISIWRQSWRHRMYQWPWACLQGGVSSVFVQLEEPRCCCAGCLTFQLQKTYCITRSELGKQLRQVITKCLTEASNRQYGSIAFPVLGTGVLGYPTDVVAKTMLDAIKQFELSTPSTTLREARIVVYHADKQALAVFHTIKKQTEGGQLIPSTVAHQVAQPSGSGAKFDVGGLTLVIKEGDITEETVDAIVNSSNDQLDLSRVGDIKSFGVAVTPACNIKCKFIVHIDAQIFAQGNLNAGIKLCLLAAEEKGVQSMALPALGTGGYGMSAQASATALFNVVTKFKQRESLQELRVVLFDKKIVEEYIMAVMKAAASYNEESKGLTRRLKGLAGHSKPVVTFMGRYSTAVFEKKANLYVYAESQNSVRAVLESLAKMVKDRDITRRDLMKTLTLTSVPRQSHRLPASLDGIVGLIRWYMLPEHWDKHADTEQLKLVPLDQSGDEYQQVERNFRATLDDRNVTIITVHRVQNPTQYRQYETKKDYMKKQNPDIDNERTLWHGTAADAIKNINLYGFNRSYCGKNATAFGQGVYFAVNSSYSTSTTYSPRDPSGNRHVYQCKVLVGHPVQGNGQLKTLPSRTGDILYDSATDDTQKPSLYVIFNDTQAYPEYLITFH